MRQVILFSVKDILEEIFFEDVRNEIQLLKDNHVYEIVESNLSHLRDKNEESIQRDFNTITLSFVQKINDHLKHVEDQSIKNRLKYILGEIGNYIIDSLVNNNVLTHLELVTLDESLKSLSELNAYDYSDINMRLQIKRLIRNKSNGNNVQKVTANEKAHYLWLEKNHKLDEITDNLYSEKIITSKKSFRKLFSGEPIKVSVSNEKADFLFILFDVLHENRYIKPKGIQGKFQPLCQNCVDLDGKILFKTEPKYIKQKIKRTPKTHEKLRSKAETWISGF
jgi:hypothetical protein